MGRATRTQDLPERITALAEPAVAAADIELVEVEVRGSHGSRVVRVVVDAEDGVDVDRIAEVSRSIGELLDDHDLVAGAYTLEVSSPGADQPLHGPRDFGRNVGRQVSVLRNPNRPEGAPGEVTGTVTEVTDTILVLEIDDEPVELTFEEIEHGKVVLPW